MKISALVPAYNEEKTITSVIKALQENKLIDEVIVVNDGSSDQTAELARLAGARVINHPYNKGKGAALQTGLDNLDSEVVLMLDGDLLGLEAEHINCLLEPLLKDQADMVVGVFSQGRKITDLAQFLAPYLSGQRAFKRSLTRGMPSLVQYGFGVEIFLSNYFREHGRLEFVELPNLSHIMKEEKRGLIKGIMARLQMYWEILKIFIRS